MKPKKCLQDVTLYTRVWIEILIRSETYEREMSPSTRGCGLKSLLMMKSVRNSRHPLHEGVDWNIMLYMYHNAVVVTLYTRVWIEIWPLESHLQKTTSHPLHEGVDWNVTCISEIVRQISHPLHEGVDWNIYAAACLLADASHPLHEGVDWNASLSKLMMLVTCHPLHEGVDWNCCRATHIVKPLCHPLHEGVDWNIVHSRWKENRHPVTLYTRVWIEISIIR